MENHARDAYVEAQVTTAGPHKLHLMLIEGAARFARQALVCYEQGQFDDGVEKLSKCREIISEVMLSFVSTDKQLLGQVQGIYLFMFRELTEAQLTRDPGRIQRVIEILAIEAETWQMVCQRDGGGQTQAIEHSEPISGPAGSRVPAPRVAENAAEAEPGFSLDA